MVKQLGKQKVIIFNSEKRHSGTALYRAYAAEACLKDLGFHVDLLDGYCVDNNCFFDHIYLSDVTACLFVRTPLTDAIDNLIELLRGKKVKVIADFDDLIFCPELLHLWDGMNYLHDIERQNVVTRATQYQQMIKAADYVVATTLPLATEISRYNKNVKVIRNYPLDLATSLIYKVEKDQIYRDEFIVGYYSGTLTHQADFGQCVKSLVKFMKRHRNAKLRIVGELNLAEFSDFNGLESQIDHLPLMPYKEMLLDLSLCDVNIAPLQLGNLFCECKSELKYFDAAIVCVPTIASPTQPYRTAIRHGINGFLANTSDEWFIILENLYHDRNLIKNIGLSARRYVLSFYGKAAQLKDYRDLIESVAR